MSDTPKMRCERSDCSPSSRVLDPASPSSSRRGPDEPQHSSSQAPSRRRCCQGSGRSPDQRIAAPQGPLRFVSSHDSPLRSSNPTEVNAAEVTRYRITRKTVDHICSSPVDKDIVCLLYTSDAADERSSV